MLLTDHAIFLLMSRLLTVIANLKNSWLFEIFMHSFINITLRVQHQQLVKVIYAEGHVHAQNQI